MRPQLPSAPFLYVITDAHLAKDRPDRLVERVIGCRVPVVQMRHKSTSDSELVKYARAATDASAGKGMFILNDRVDIALLSGADGVHVGDSDLAVADIRRLAGSKLIVGRSTHSVDEALRASEEDVDYIALGPIYASTTKQSRSALGVDAIAAVKARGIRCPLVAIGGIGAGQLTEVVRAGADGIAMISAVMGEDVEGSCGAMLAMLQLVASVCAK